MPDITVNETQLQLLQTLARTGSQRAAEALGFFSGDMLTVNDAMVNIMAFEAMPYFHDHPDEVVVGVHFAIDGALDGYLLAYFHLQDVTILLKALLGESAPLEALGAMELSALGEAGNIIVSSFLAALEELCGLCVQPSPPAVAVEMSGAILSSAILPVVEDGSEVFFVHASLQAQGAGDAEGGSCTILFLPTPSAWPRLLAALGGSDSPPASPSTAVTGERAS